MKFRFLILYATATKNLHTSIYLSGAAMTKHWESECFFSYSEFCIIPKVMQAPDSTFGNIARSQDFHVPMQHLRNFFVIFS